MFALIRSNNQFQVKAVERVEAHAIFWRGHSLTLRARVRARELSLTPRSDVLAFFNYSSEAVAARQFMTEKVFDSEEALTRAAMSWPHALPYAAKVGFTQEGQ